MTVSPLPASSGVRTAATGRAVVVQEAFQPRSNDRRRSKRRSSNGSMRLHDVRRQAARSAGGSICCRRDNDAGSCRQLAHSRLAWLAAAVVLLVLAIGVPLGTRAGAQRGTGSAASGAATTASAGSGAVGGPDGIGEEGEGGLVANASSPLVTPTPSGSPSWAAGAVQASASSSATQSTSPTASMNASRSYSASPSTSASPSMSASRSPSLTATTTSIASSSPAASPTAAPCVWRSLQGIRAVLWSTPANLTTGTPCDSGIAADLGCNVWWLRDDGWGNYTATRNATLALLRHALAAPPVAATAAGDMLSGAGNCSAPGVVLYVPAFIADSARFGPQPLERLGQVVTDLHNAGLQVLLLIGRPEYAADGGWNDVVHDLPKRAVLQAYIRAILAVPAVMQRVHFVSVYWMGMSHFCTTGGCSREEIAAFAAALASTVKAVGGFAYLHHVDGPLWEAHYTQNAAAAAAGGSLNGSWHMNGYGPESLAPDATAADGMLAECWLQGSLVNGVRSFAQYSGFRVGTTDTAPTATPTRTPGAASASPSPSTSPLSSPSASPTSLEPAPMLRQFPTCAGSLPFLLNGTASDLGVARGPSRPAAGTQFLLLMAVANCADEAPSYSCAISTRDPGPDVTTWFTWVRSSLGIQRTWAVWEWLSGGASDTNAYGHVRHNGTAIVASSGAVIDGRGVASPLIDASAFAAALTTKGAAFQVEALADAGAG